MASLFLFKLCRNYFIVAALLAGISMVTWTNWRNGSSNKWSYSWLGYAVAAAAISVIVSVHAVSYGAWLLLTGRGLPVFDPLLLLIGCSPLAMWNVARLAHEMVKRDWLWVSFAALPLPMLASWVFFLHSDEVYLGVNLEMLGQMAYTHIIIFVALALMTALYLKIGRRAIRLSILLAGAAALGYVGCASRPSGLHLPNLAMMFVAYLALFAAPVLWKSLIHRHRLIQRAVT